MIIKYFLGSCFIIFLFASCKKETEVLKTDLVQNYFPLQTGKFITYNLDSTVFTKFGQNKTIIHYQAQDRVDAQITDNLGRPAFRIFRYLRSNSSQPWVPDNTFLAVPTENGIEYVEDNLRFLKLMNPVQTGFSWKGNSFIDTYSPEFGLTYLDNWDYTYDSLNAPLTLNSLQFDSTITVLERDEFLGNDPALTTTLYAEKTYSVEKYAKGVGLIYRRFLHWEYQGPQPDRPGYYTGYGVEMSITDHN